MFFLFYLSIAQCKRVLDNPYPTPEVYPIAVSTRQIKKSESDLQCEPFDPECPFDDLSSITNINCGQRCWSDYGTGFLEYSFKGVQFVLYGKKAPNHGTFDLIINESDPIEITETSEQTDVYALLYTSEYLPYGEHRIQMKGKGTPFELFRLSYWPSLKARRYNVTQFTSTDTWVSESDENGGIREYTNNLNARKSISVEGSKVWVYASKAFNHGIMNVKFDVVDENINTQVPTIDDRVDGCLVFESRELPFGFLILT